MARPDRQQLKQAVFEFFADGKVHDADEVEETMARRFRLTREGRLEMQARGIVPPFASDASGGRFAQEGCPCD